MSNSTEKTKRLVGLSIFTALVVVLQLVATFVKIGAFPVTLTLVPIVVGAAIYGTKGRGLAGRGVRRGGGHCLRHRRGPQRLHTLEP